MLEKKVKLFIGGQFEGSLSGDTSGSDAKPGDKFLSNGYHRQVGPAALSLSLALLA